MALITIYFNDKTQNKSNIERDIKKGILYELLYEENSTFNGIKNFVKGYVPKASETQIIKELQNFLDKNIIILENNRYTLV